MNVNHAKVQDQERLAGIQPHFRIQVLHQDDDLIVIDKPCNLRSVPGHANPPLAAGGSRKRFRAQQSANRPDGNDEPADTSNRKTAQEAWEAAIRSFGSKSNGCEKSIDGQDDNHPSQNTYSQEIQNCLKRLATSQSLVASVPRKQTLFLRYIQRNHKRIFDTSQELSAEKREQLGVNMFLELQKQQKSLLNLPEPTRHEESAYGQLILMGYTVDDEALSDNSKDQVQTTNKAKKLFVVHRLDCETSGVMVFARNQEAASKLCRAWREREEVSKFYLAIVNKWSPFHNDNMVSGRINVPLTPSEERLKWKVAAADDPKGKSSTTLWWIDNSIEQHKESGQHQRRPVLLKLQPLTGRTHQLRIHCAHIGSGIIGDSLYGSDRVDCLGQDGKRLLLHAHILSFVHPSTNEICEFSCPPRW